MSEPFITFGMGILGIALVVTLFFAMYHIIAIGKAWLVLFGYSEVQYSNAEGMESMGSPFSSKHHLDGTRSMSYYTDTRLDFYTHLWCYVIKYGFCGLIGVVLFYGIGVVTKMVMPL